MGEFLFSLFYCRMSGAIPKGGLKLHSIDYKIRVRTEISGVCLFGLFHSLQDLFWAGRYFSLVTSLA